MTVLGSGESGIEECDRLRTDSREGRRGGRSDAWSLELNRCRNAYGIRKVTNKSLITII